MQKVTDKLDNFILNGVHFIRFEKGITSARCIDADKQIANKISELEDRLAALKELQEFMNTKEQLYLFRDDCSGFCYTDKSGEIYEYKEAHGKHLLIDKDFNIYEIVEYEGVNDITRIKGFPTQIEKIVKITRLGNHG